MDGFADGSADGLVAVGNSLTDGSTDHQNSSGSSGGSGSGAARGGEVKRSVRFNSVLVVAATNRPEVKRSQESTNRKNEEKSVFEGVFFMYAEDFP